MAGVGASLASSSPSSAAIKSSTGKCFCSETGGQPSSSSGGQGSSSLVEVDLFGGGRQTSSTSSLNRNMDTSWMIECDVCKTWFHGGCVKLNKVELRFQGSANWLFSLSSLETVSLIAGGGGPHRQIPLPEVRARLRALEGQGRLEHERRFDDGRDWATRALLRGLVSRER